MIIIMMTRPIQFKVQSLFPFLALYLYTYSFAIVIGRVTDDESATHLDFRQGTD